MMFTTHLHIGHYLYDELKKNGVDDSGINRWMFIFGNVKPDITKMVRLKHKFSETYDIYSRNLGMAQDETLTVRQRSVALGVVCHMLCDYFCKFHAKAPYNEYPLWNHFLYEWKLHFTVIKEIWNKRMSGINHIKNPFEHSDMVLKDEGDQIDKQAESCGLPLLDLLASYYLKEEKTVIDKDFALYAVNTVFKQVFGIEVFKVTDEEAAPDAVLVNDEQGIIGVALNGKVVALNDKVVA